MTGPAPRARNQPKLPAGWRWVSLGDLSSGPEAFADGPFGSNLKTEHYVSAGARVVRLQNIGRGVFLDADKSFISLDHFASLRRHSVRPGDVVVAALGDGARPAGRACVIPDGFGPGLVKADCFRLRLPADSILAPYLAGYLNSPVALSRVADTMRGATRPRMNLAMLRAVELPLAPLAQQREIVGRLGEQMAAVERTRAAAEAQLETARALEPARLRNAFDGPQTRHWPRKPLGEVGEIVSGITLGRQLRDVRTRRVPYLRVANVKDGYLDLSEVYEIDATGAELERLRLHPGDLLLTEGGDPDKLGRGTFWKGQLPECIHQNHIFRVRFDPREFLPEFVSAQVGSPYGKSYFLAHAKRTTGIATINQKVLAAFPLMAPRLGDQRRIASMLDERMVEAERLRKAAEEQLAAINALPAALLRRAFSGAL